MGFRVIDIECYVNYFLLLSRNSDTGVIHRWEQHDDIQRGKAIASLRNELRNDVAVTFNGLGYDWWMLSAYLKQFTNKQLFRLSSHLVSKHNAHWECGDKFGLVEYNSPHIDIMPVAPLIASLKMYCGRLHAPMLQDLPVDPHMAIDDELRDELIPYCINDVELTELLKTKLMPQLKLRRAMGKKYGMNLLSKSDAQIAEAVIKHELQALGVAARRPDGVPASTYHFDPPACVKFHGEEFSEALRTVVRAAFKLGASRNLLCPKEVRKPIEFNGRNYQMGIGGLHSMEKSQSVRLYPGESLTDLDVTSYYPQLILTNKLYPDHLGSRFLTVYERIVNDRIKAKASGDMITADALKIVVNSSFGKFGSQYSALYSPKLLLQTTISGQLYLLMLIEQIETYTRCKVVSANTDGVTVWSPTRKARTELALIAKAWCDNTQLELEAVEYKALFAQDVNNYLAVKTDGSTKGKGVFASQSLSKNPQAPIVQHAAIQYLTERAPIGDTVRHCDDITQFATLRRVTGGALHRDDNAGSVVRWYASTNGSPLLYLNNRNRVPNAANAQLINRLPDELPNDIDYGYYITKASELVKGVGMSC